MKKSIAILGAGFVGGSLAQVFSERGFDVYSYDKAGKIAPGAQSPARLALISNVSDAIVGLVEHVEKNVKGFTGVFFVCLPTPMKKDGSADLSIVDGAIKAIASVEGERVIVVKSTVPPGSTERWNEELKDTKTRVVFSPEFLTEQNALDDMRNQNRIILGGPRPWINKVKQVFQFAFPSVPLIKTSSTTAEMVKYMTNVHLAARVVLSCELAEVCEALDKQGLNIDYDKVMEYAKCDVRLGGSHMMVPGPDGHRGARGHCFPKDLNAIISLSKKIGVNPTVMEAINTKNLSIVSPENRDWEHMVGRAVSDEK
jgi:UDPglucose 6-dehydrogenase